jgi:hypothetical protein
MSNPMTLKDYSTAALRERRHRLAQGIPPIEQVMRGTLSATFKRCGRPNCHCVDDAGHGPKHYLSVSHYHERPQRDYVRNVDAGRAAEFISNLHQLRKALDEICAINTELMRRHEDFG